MKVPVYIDLRRASFTRSQFGNRVNVARGVRLGSIAGGPSVPVAPLQIMSRASVARANCDLDSAAILSRSCLIVALSVPPIDSTFIVSTSRETCTDSISGKLCCESERVGGSNKGVTHEKEKLENTSAIILQCARFS
jgi:hypothetical protein